MNERSAAAARVPQAVIEHIRAAGAVMDFSVIQLFAALHPREPYDGVKVTRDVAYGPDPLHTLDIFEPEEGGSGRPVLLFVHGGGFVGGDKHMPGSPFQDNVLVWATRNGMVGVNINYRLAPKDPWPAGAKDLGAAIAWVKANIEEYGGDDGRVFIFGHSAGANHVADYVAHPEVQGPEAASVRGAIPMSPFYARVLREPSPYYGEDMPLAGADAAIARLVATPIPLFLADAEYDPDFFRIFMGELRKGLDAAGRPYTYHHNKDHNHFSEGNAIGTADTQLTDPLLAWMRAQP